MAISRYPRYEFDLKITRYQDKNQERDSFYSMSSGAEEPDEYEAEVLEYKARSATEVLRKLLDYVTNK